MRDGQAPRTRQNGTPHFDHPVRTLQTCAGSLGLQMKRLFASALVLACTSPAIAQTDRIRFWNLTANTITRFYLAPAGTGKYGPDQCVNDRDGTVDHDERLRITGVTPGRY